VTKAIADKRTQQLNWKWKLRQSAIEDLKGRILQCKRENEDLNGQIVV